MSCELSQPTAARASQQLDGRARSAVVLALTIAALPSGSWQAFAQLQQPLVHELDNGMRFVLLPRQGHPSIGAGWVVRAGTIDGRSGAAHMLEHLMFNGTRTIGTRSIYEETAITARIDALQSEIDRYQRELLRRQRIGEIDNAWAPAERGMAHQALIDELESLMEQRRSLLNVDEFSNIYQTHGASGLNGAGSQDSTMFWVSIPANALELWFWLESDRLTNPVFREFLVEKETILEELRTVEATPQSRIHRRWYSRSFDPPYNRTVPESSTDIRNITKEEVRDFFESFYVPENISAVLVGDFDPAVAIELAERYFGHLQAGTGTTSTVGFEPVRQAGETRMIFHAAVAPEVLVAYRTVADGHRDEPALAVLAAILGGRNGRLSRSLVEEQELATRADALQASLEYGGLFQILAVAADAEGLETLEVGLHREFERLQRETVSELELRRVKNQITTAEYRQQARSNLSLMLRFLSAEGGRGWETLYTDPPRYEAVTAEDVRRVASTYFGADNRTVALVYRGEEATQ